MGNQELECAQIVLGQGYPIRTACETMGVSKSAMELWGHQWRSERAGNSPKVTHLTPEQLRIRELEKKAYLPWKRKIPS
ncbi:transposase [Aeromonas sp. 164P]